MRATGLSFQNGEPAIIVGYRQARRLHVLLGSKVCIFLHPAGGGVEEIHEISLGGGPISIPVSMMGLLQPLTFSPNYLRFQLGFFGQ